MRARTFGVGLLTVVAARGVGAVEPAPGPGAGPLALERHRGAPTSPDLLGPAGAPVAPRQARAAGAGPCATVFGYLPYWVSAESLRYDLLTHLACFSAEVNADGTLGNTHGWPWTGVINTAHANGVEVVLVATLFGSADVEAFLTDPAARIAFLVNIRDALLAGDADGLNIDFEGFEGSGWVAHMPGFLAELTAYLAVEIPGCAVTVAGPAVNWGGAWDLPAVAAACDAIFIMGYDFYGSWSGTSGPCAPLTGGSYNVTNTVEVQYADVLATSPEKLILGVPYFGNHWRTSSSAPYATTLAWIDWVTYAAEASATHGIQWDGISQTPWYRWQVGNDWQQVWFENEDSFALKIDLALTHGLRGVGMWALGYDGARPGLWDTIEEGIGTGCGPVGDVDGDGVVNVFDLLDLLAAWGPCPAPPQTCPADLEPDGVVNVFDLLILLAHFGES